MQFTELNAEFRQKSGTGISRKLRREGLLPAVLYGKGHKSQILQVNEKEVDKILRTKLGQNTLIHLNVKGGDDQKVIIKDYQGDVLTRRLTHIDFLVVREDQDILVYVPVRIEGKPVGITQGGILEVVTREVELLCKIGHIPEAIVVDVSGLNVGQNLHLSDIKLPVGTKRADKDNPTIAAVFVPKQEEIPVTPTAADAAAAAAVPTSAQKTEAEKAAAGATPAAGAAKPEAGKAAAPAAGKGAKPEAGKAAPKK